MAYNFGLGKPRRFHHTFIYYDERKERLRQLEQRARAELGLGNVKDGLGHDSIKSGLGQDEVYTGLGCDDAKTGLGQGEAKPDFHPEELRGTFRAASGHVNHPGGFALGNILMMLLILLCVLLLIVML